MELSSFLSEHNDAEKPLNCAPASEAPRTAAYHMIGSDEIEQEAGTTAFDNPRCLRVLVMVLGTVFGCCLVIASFVVFAFSIFTMDSGKEGPILHVGSWVWLLSFLVMLLAVGVISVSCQYATNRKNGWFVVQSLGGLLAYDVVVLLLYFPIDWVLTHTLDAFLFFPFNVWMRWFLSLWLPWKALNRLGWTPHVVGALLVCRQLLSHCAFWNRPRRAEAANRFGIPEV